MNSKRRPDSGYFRGFLLNTCAGAAAVGVFEIRPDDAVVATVVDGIADERLEVVLPFEIAPVEGVAVAAEKYPVILGLEGGGIVVDDCGVAHDPVMRIELDHRVAADRRPYRKRARPRSRRRR